MEEIAAGRRPAVTHRTPYQPYRKHPQYTGFMALYVHYLYVLGKIQKQQYPPRMTPHLKQEVMKFERYREKFQILRENNIATPNDMAAFQVRTEETLTELTKQRTVLNVRKKKRAPLYAALADAEALAMAKHLYDEGRSGMEQQFEQYMEALAVLENCGIPRERLTTEKAELYEQLAQLNRQIRSERKKLALCREIQQERPKLEQDIQRIEKPVTDRSQKDAQLR